MPGQWRVFFRSDRERDQCDGKAASFDSLADATVLLLDVGILPFQINLPFDRPVFSGPDHELLEALRRVHGDSELLVLLAKALCRRNVETDVSVCRVDLRRRG